MTTITATTHTSTMDLPTTMRAWQWSTCTTTLEDALTLNPSAPLPNRPLTPGECLVKVHAASLNPVDYKLPELPIVGRLAIPKPATPGLDFSGTVVKASEPSTLQPGQRVFGKLEPKQQFGTLGEYIIGSAAGTVPLPDSVSFEEGATLGVCGLVTYQCLTRNAKSGDRVLINGGSGGTGTFAIQIAKALGCEVVTTSSGNPPPLQTTRRNTQYPTSMLIWCRSQHLPLHVPRRRQSPRLPHPRHPSHPPNHHPLQHDPRQHRRPCIPLLVLPLLHHPSRTVHPNRLASQSALPVRPGV